MFFEFGIKDIIDILLVAILLYYIYRLMKESRSLNVFMGILVFVVLWLVVAQVLQMRLLGSILDKFVSVGVIVLVVLFQEEIRKFLYNLGAHQRMRTFRRFFSINEKKQDQTGPPEIETSHHAYCDVLYEHEQKEGRSTYRHPADNTPRRYCGHR